MSICVDLWFQAWVLMQYNVSEISDFIAMKNATGLSKDDKGILSSLWGWIFGGGGSSGGGVSSGGTSSGVSNEISVEDAESPGAPVDFPTCNCREFAFALCLLTVGWNGEQLACAEQRCYARHSEWGHARRKHYNIDTFAIRVRMIQISAESSTLCCWFLCSGF